MSETNISMAAEGLVIIEQYCQEEHQVHTVIITQHDLFDLCALVWPEEQAKWIAICAAEGKPWPPVEKNPQAPVREPEGYSMLVEMLGFSIAERGADASPGGLPEAP